MKLTDSLSSYVNILNFVGAWQQESTLSKMYAVISVGLFNILHLLTMAIHMVLNPQELSSSIYIFLILAISAFKFYYISKYASVNKYLMEMLDREEFKPKVYHESLVKTMLKPWDISCQLYNTGAVFAVISIIAPAIFVGKKWGLPYKAWYPFEYKFSPVYEFVYFYQSFCVCNICAMNTATDNYLTGLMCHISIQCKLLAENLRNMKEFAIMRLEKTVIDEQEMEESFQICLKHYRLILEFYENVAILSNYTIFVQFTASLLSYSLSLLFASSLSPSDAAFWTITICAGACVLQLLVYCYRGNEVLVQSSNLPIAAFECGWEDCSPTMKKDVIFFMVRTQKPLQMYALDFFLLNFNTFLWILRASYSYFAVLRQANKK